jgi:hypothetical protein
MKDSEKVYKEFNLIELGLLPSGWYEDIIELAESKSYLVHLDGKSSTSREPSDSKGADVFVVDGESISNRLIWLDNLYKNELLNLADDSFENKFCISNSVENGVNINYLKGINARYEWHVDSNPLTGIMYVTNHNEGEGGELVFKVGESIQKVYPKSGTFILFDARELPHTVMPLKTDTFRISVPMNFYLKNNVQERPLDLDTYIYKK